MRPAIVLLVLAAGLLAVVLLRKEREASFDARYDRTEERIRVLADDITEDLSETDE
ncbi:hypothetical protein CP97_14631 [Aurantiacibacter atlanticus]|uniref:Uncharacterized protein n=2 Tax=Aurantiacibacter atlanticus TaxID=1648404 RepID=A0A168LZV5_9SPHN|nr:hypothetical protein CP97_14631 [Aurantiacibacter atlanticus]